MKKSITALPVFILALTLMLAGCAAGGQTAAPTPYSTLNEEVSDSVEASDAADTQSGESTAAQATELVVRFGDNGEVFTMHLEDNDTAAAIANYVGTSEWRLPIYHYDESEVMQYYDIPSRYDIPSNSTTVTAAAAGDVYYSDPNRIVLYYHDADISEEYTKIGTFDATEEFVAAVEDNPVLEGWGNKIVIISDGE